jgi:3-hydroxybutyryl-CoA dehydrogenase
MMINGRNWKKLQATVLDDFDAAAILKLQKPVLLNSVIETLSQLKTGSNVVRINGWDGFLQRKVWEVAGKVTGEIQSVFSAMEKECIEVADAAGLVAARSISMIINEAYFALAEEVSTKDEIDIAMNLGTNYPLGPFEWAKKIGLKNIYGLLCVLAENDKRYLPAPLLKKEATV